MSAPKPWFTPEERAQRHNAVSRAYRKTSRTTALETGCIRNLRMRGCNITKEAYQKLMTAKTCAVCGVEFVREPWTNMSAPVLDHDHQSGHPRKALCRGCNIGLGMFKESTEVLLKAAQYLLEFNHGR